MTSTRPLLARPRRHRKILAGATLAALGVAAGSALVMTSGPAGAVSTAPVTKLKAAGPVSGDNGFPVWYKDNNDLALQLCLDPTEPLCGFPLDELPDVDAPVSFPSNFPGEAFYMLAGAEIPLPGAVGARAVLTTGLEAAFLTPEPVAGQQMVFGRVRIIVDVPNAGTFKVTHPYGTDTFEVAQGGDRAIRFVEDIGANVGQFDDALQSRVNPFLMWDTGLVKGPDGSSYLGDPAIPHRVKGSELGTNVFKIEGPNIGGPGVNVVQTDLFTLQGKVATAAGVSPGSATYTPVAGSGGGYIDVFASSQPNQTIQVTGPGVTSTTLRGDGTGHYFARARYVGDLAPQTVSITNSSDRPASTFQVPLVDRVVVTKADYNSDTKELTVRANSSALTAPTLSVPGYFASLDPDVDNVMTTDVPPEKINVFSTRGGQGSMIVTVSGVAMASDPVLAEAGPSITVASGLKVVLDGSASLNGTTYLWTQEPDGTPVSLAGANGPVATFTAPAAGSVLTFKLTVTNVAGETSTDTVTVTVTPTAAPIANAGPAQTVLQGAKVTLDASLSQGATSYSWAQMPGGPVVSLAGPTTAKPTFTMPTTSVPLLFQVTVKGPGGQDTSTVQVNPVPDVLTTDQVEFRAGGNEWRISGTSTVTLGNTVTAYLNGTTKVKIGTATVDALGVWSIRIKNSTVRPTAGATISLESTRGGILASTPVFVR